MAAILNSTLSNLAILDSAILVFPFKLTHTCQDWFPSFAQKNFIHALWLNLMMAAILNSAILDSAILVFPLKLTHTCQDWFPQFVHKKLHSFILTQLVEGSHLEFCHLEFGHLGFSHLSISSQTHSHLLRLVPNICTKKTSFIHSDLTWRWQPILNSAMLDSDTAILDSDTLLSSVRFTQKHSHSTLTLTLTQTN